MIWQWCSGLLQQCVLLHRSISVMFLWTDCKTDITVARACPQPTQDRHVLMAPFSLLDSALSPNGKEKLLSVTRDSISEVRLREDAKCMGSSGRETRWTLFPFTFCLLPWKWLLLILSYNGTVMSRNSMWKKETIDFFSPPLTPFPALSCWSVHLKNLCVL